MSQASRWLDGFAAAAARLGVRGEGLAELLPPDSPLPPWWRAFAASPSPEARAAALAPAFARLRVALEGARFRWP